MQRMSTLLRDEGYEVKGFNVSAEALEELKQTQENPYTLIISSYMMPKMKGDEILTKVRAIQPEAQRLLLTDTSDFDIVVRTINAVSIQAALTLPFTDNTLLHQVQICCDTYDANHKQKNLKRVTQRQNRQLFQIASNFKKKDTLYTGQIAQRDKEIRVLESRIRSAGGSLETEKGADLQDVLDGLKTDLTPEDFADRFVRLKNGIKKLMETAASSKYLSIQDVMVQTIVKQQGLDIGDRDTARQMLQLLYPLLINLKDSKETDSSRQVKNTSVDDMFSLQLTEDNTKALIRLRTFESHHLDLTHVKQFLEKYKIINGLIPDEQIVKWLVRSTPDDPPFVIAQGRPALAARDAEIKYHFSIDFLHAGKVNEDGSINFQDRGEIPYVKEGDFLAAKIFPEEGKNGMDVYGREIVVEEAVDLTFSSGPGTRISEDGVRIYATTSGQPHLDAMGNISVCPEFMIKGDLGFETGDVDFDGNVIVAGSVKEGFKVRCASLTAKEIQGAEIDIEGDLNVSLGIVDTELVKVKGCVQAKFVHNSKINSFGDLIIQKEIIDSKILLSGACVNETGTILNCEISAKMGIQGGTIGNKSSKASTLSVGVDEHTNLLISKVDAKLNRNNTVISELREELTALEKEDRDLHGVITPACPHPGQIPAGTQGYRIKNGKPEGIRQHGRLSEGGQYRQGNQKKGGNRRRKN